MFVLLNGNYLIKKKKQNKTTVCNKCIAELTN